MEITVTIDDAIRDRISELIEQSQALSVGDGNDSGQCTDDKQIQRCTGWIAAAHNVVHLLCESPSTPYRQAVDRIASLSHGYAIHNAVGELAEILKSLMSDAQVGMLASVADQARAELFDDFLDHADVYYKDSRKNESGVISGVVFEDTLRRICTKVGIPQMDVKLDVLISELAKQGKLSGMQAKRARSAAHLRTKASHAQWDEFTLDDVRATIDFTRELIASHLDG